MRRAGTLIATSLLLVLIAAPAYSQTGPYPPADDQPQAGVSQNVVFPGQTIEVSGRQWLPGSDVTIEFLSTPVLLGSARVDASGRFATQVRIPLDATAGPHTIRVSGLDTDRVPRVVSIPITVRAVAAAPPAASPASPPAVTPRTGALARTGGYLTTGGSLAVLLLVVGCGALFASRRLSRTAT
jgi:hypothetical protein